MSWLDRISDAISYYNPFRVDKSESSRQKLFEWEHSDYQNKKDQFYDTFLDAYRNVIGDALPAGLQETSNALVNVAKYQHKNDIAYRTLKEGDEVGLADRLVPKYGNFAGPKYTAGEYTNKVDVNKILNTPPIDELDYVTKIHDIDYILARSKDDLKKADKALLKNLEKIDYNKLSRDGKTYYDLAKKSFELKLKTGIGYDFNESDIVHDSNIRKQFEDWLHNDRSYGWTPETYNKHEQYRDNVVAQFGVPIKTMRPAEKLNLYLERRQQAIKDIETLQDYIFALEDDEDDE